MTINLRARIQRLSRHEQSPVVLSTLPPLTQGRATSC